MADQQLNIKLNVIDNASKAFTSVKNSIFWDFFTIWDENSSIKTIYLVIKVAYASTGSGFSQMLQDIIFIEIKPSKEYRRELNALVITSILPSSRANPD